MASPPEQLDTSDWKVYCIQTEDGEHYLKIVSSNGRSLMHSETYTNFQHAVQLGTSMSVRFGCAYVYKGAAKARPNRRKVN